MQNVKLGTIHITPIFKMNVKESIFCERKLAHDIFSNTSICIINIKETQILEVTDKRMRRFTVNVK